MSHYEIIEIPKNFSFEVDSSLSKLSLSATALATIDRIWNEEETKRKGHLFNGKILNLVQLEKDRLVGKFIDYKYYIAQLREPSLKSLLKICPISISGITLMGNKILVAQRSASVTQYPEYYEFVPSGGIDLDVMIGGYIDYRLQFAKELSEETGIESSKILRISPLCLVHDLDDNILEVCAKIHLDLKIDTDLVQNQEYQRFFWFSHEELFKFLQEHKNACIPLMHILAKVLD